MPRITRSVTMGALAASAALALSASTAPAAPAAPAPAAVSSAASAQRGHVVVAQGAGRVELARKRESNRCRALRKKAKRNPALRMCNRGRGKRR